MSAEESLDSLRLEVERQRESVGPTVVVVVLRVNELGREYEEWRGEIHVVKNLAGGEIEKLKYETERVAKPPSSLEPP
jgi:hypothetical protein